MTILEPLPASGYGKADWVDYSNYWRELDSEWLMERSILRYADAASRSNAAQFPTPKFGQTTYNEATDRLEVYSKIAAAWATVAQFVNLKSSQDTAAGVALSHTGAGNKGIVFEPTRTVLDNPIFVMGGVLTVDATGVSVRTGAKTVKLTTNATDLVSDSGITAIWLTSTGGITAANANLSGTLTAPNITMTGTLTGGVVNGTSGTIGSVAHSGGRVTAANGFDASNGSFFGDGNGAQMRHINRNGPYVQATTGAINVGGGGYLDIYSQPRIFGGQSIHYIRADGYHTGYFAPHFWGDPGVGNCPEGSIMIQ